MVRHKTKETPRQPKTPSRLRVTRERMLARRKQNGPLSKCSFARGALSLDMAGKLPDNGARIADLRSQRRWSALSVQRRRAAACTTPSPRRTSREPNTSTVRASSARAGGACMTSRQEGHRCLLVPSRRVPGGEPISTDAGITLPLAACGYGCCNHRRHTIDKTSSRSPSHAKQRYLLVGAKEDGLARELGHDAADRDIGNLVDGVQPIALGQAVAQKVADCRQALAS